MEPAVQLATANIREPCSPHYGGWIASIEYSLLTQGMVWSSTKNKLLCFVEHITGYFPLTTLCSQHNKLPVFFGDCFSVDVYQGCSLGVSECVSIVINNGYLIYKK